MIFMITPSVSGPRIVEGRPQNRQSLRERCAGFSIKAAEIDFVIHRQSADVVSLPPFRKGLYGLAAANFSCIPAIKEDNVPY
jgi:hypothetical protein